MDFKIALFLNQLGHGTVVDKITGFVSEIPLLVFLGLLVAIIILAIDKKNGKWIIAAILFAIGLHFLISEELIKNLFHFFRFRPYVNHLDIFAIGVKFIDSSFPSGHMAIIGGFLTVLVYHYRKLWPWVLIFMFLMGFARIHNGMHYPTDVLAGTILGVIYGLFGVWILIMFKKRFV